MTVSKVSRHCLAQVTDHGMYIRTFQGGTVFHFIGYSAGINDLGMDGSRHPFALAGCQGSRAFDYLVHHFASSSFRSIKKFSSCTISIPHIRIRSSMPSLPLWAVILSFATSYLQRT